MRRLITVIIWIFAAIGVSGVGTAAVNQVTSQVNDPPAAPLSAEALEALPSTPTLPPAAPPATQPTTPAPSTTTPTTAPDSTTTSTSPAVSTTTTTPTSTPTTSPGTTTTTTTAPATTTTTVATTPTTTPRFRTFNLIGGSVIIELLGDGIAWRSSTPRSGYTVSVEETGPEKVVVEFESTDPDNPHSSELEALWVDGRLEWKVEEED